MAITNLCKNKEVNFLVCVLVALFGMGSWIAVNGLWVELPLLVQELPEGWELPSYLVVIIQIANIGPIAFTVASTVSKGRLNEKPVVFLILAIGTIACLLLALFWDHTSVVGGAEHSTALFAFAFLVAIVDCTSSVVFLPFMTLFKPVYITVLYVGEGFSGLIPSLVALVQGVGGNPECMNQTSVTNITINGTVFQTNGTNFLPINKPPLFEVEVFFYFLFGMMLVCGIAFTLLNFLPICKQEHQHVLQKNYQDEDRHAFNAKEQTIENVSPEGSYDGHIDVDKTSASGAGIFSSDINRGTSRGSSDASGQVLLRNPNQPKELSNRDFFQFLIIIAWINALGNGVLPSIQSFSCLPYGNTTYHLTVTFANISNPVACFVAFLYPTKSKTASHVLCGLATVFAAYILYLAAMSPEPPLLGNPTGEIFVILAWIFFTGLNSFNKVTIATIFRDKGKKALMWCGGVTQAGSAVGALIIFFLVNVQHLFKSAPPCGT